MSARDMLAAVVPEGKDHAITRRQLADLLNVDDRTARDMVNRARLDRLPVLNDQDGKGYYLSYDEADIYRWAKQEQARADNILAPVSAILMNFEEGKQ